MRLANLGFNRDLRDWKDINNLTFVSMINLNNLFYIFSASCCATVQTKFIH